MIILMINDDDDDLDRLQGWKRMTIAMIILMINDNDDDFDRLQGWKRMTIAMIILMPINENDRIASLENDDFDIRFAGLEEEKELRSYGCSWQEERGDTL